MPAKYTMIFNGGSAPGAGSAFAARAAGWSESHWRAIADINLTNQDALIQARLGLLPNSQVLQGWRVTNYTIVQGRLVQTGVTIGALNLSGGNRATCDIPQMALQINHQATGPDVNNTVWDFRALPDTMVTGGEFSPTQAYQTQVNNYATYLSDNAWGWAGVDKSLPKVRVLSLTNTGVLTLGNGSGLSLGDFVQLFRVRADGGASLNGKYHITAVAGNNYTIEGTGTATISVPNGLARRLNLKFVDYGAYMIKGVRTHKVGAPFFKYRGRRSVRS